MKKQSDWDDALHQFLVRHKKTPFEWGKWDCCLFSDAAIKAMTGERLIPITLNWLDEPSAKEAIKNYGGTLGKSIEKAATAKGLLKVEEAQKGDLVVIKENGSEVAGISYGDNVLCPSDNGFTRKKNDLIKMVFRING
jgi:hypothetical protein